MSIDGTREAFLGFTSFIGTAICAQEALRRAFPRPRSLTPETYNKITMVAAMAFASTLYCLPANPSSSWGFGIFAGAVIMAYEGREIVIHPPSTAVGRVRAQTRALVAGAAGDIRTVGGALAGAVKDVSAAMRDALSPLNELAKAAADSASDTDEKKPKT